MVEHFHVIGGMHGCMPNFNEVCETEYEARAMFDDLVESEFDTFDLKESDVWYNTELDYAQIKGGGNEYYEITRCQENVCIKEA